MPKTDEPKAFCGEAGVEPPKIEALAAPPPVLVLVLALAAPPPKIFAAGLAAAADLNIFPAVGVAADEAGVDDIPKPPNDTDALSIDFAPKIFPPVAG